MLSCFNSSYILSLQDFTTTGVCFVLYYTIESVFIVIHKPVFSINTSSLGLRSKSKGRDLKSSREERG